MTNTKLTKVDVVDALQRRFGYRRYLEITTTTTGQRYAQAKALGFTSCQRLVYRYPGAIGDGLPVDFSAGGEDISICTDALRGSRARFDVIMVDPHHTYYCSQRDLRIARQLLARGGAIVVHDCDPPGARQAWPTFIDEAWAGTTYKAFLDLSIGNPAFDYFTLDFDWGCGVILDSVSTTRRLRNIARATKQLAFARQWRRASSHGYDDAFDFFRTHRRQLLRLGDWHLLETKLAAGL